MEEISIKSDVKKMKDYNISKIITALYYCKLSANSLAMITQLSINEIMMLLCQNMLHKKSNKSHW